jgi:hypothetical protein
MLTAPLIDPDASPVTISTDPDVAPDDDPLATLTDPLFPSRASLDDNVTVPEDP